MKQANQHRGVRKLWFPCILTLLLVLFFSFNRLWQASQSHTTPHAHITAKPTSGISILVHNNSIQAQTDSNSETDMTWLHQFAGPNGWIWRTSLPNDRLVIYYGNPDSAAMGPLGAYTDDELVARLRAQAQVYADLDPTHPVVPAFDYVTPIAQPASMADGSW